MGIVNGLKLTTHLRIVPRISGSIHPVRPTFLSRSAYLVMHIHNSAFIVDASEESVCDNEG
jgi:hypothetical protein